MMDSWNWDSLIMFGILSLAAVVAVGLATHRIDAAFEAGTFALAFFATYALFETQRQIRRLADILSGQSEPREELRGPVDWIRRTVKDIGEDQ